MDNQYITQYKSKKQQVNTQIKIYKYYAIIGIISLIAVFFLPMLGSNPAVGLNLPSTAIGWIIYLTTKVCVAVINILLFHCFMQQGLLNSKPHPNYILACEILGRYGLGPEGDIPRAPDVFQTTEYRNKGITIAITSIISAVVLTQAVLTFDWISMLTYIFTIVMGVIFGLLQQDTAETYWTDEFLKYAYKIQKEMEENNLCSNATISSIETLKSK